METHIYKSMTIAMNQCIHEAEKKIIEGELSFTYLGSHFGSTRSNTEREADIRLLKRCYVYKYIFNI